MNTIRSGSTIADVFSMPVLLGGGPIWDVFEQRLRDYESAVQRLYSPETYRTTSRRILAASLAQLRRMDQARQEAELFMVSNPHFTIRHWAASQPFRDEAMREHFIEGYRNAGLPD